MELSNEANHLSMSSSSKSIMNETKIEDETGIRTLTPQFTLHLLGWFERHQRQLPWRQSYDPYQIWISEVMLQQTQMDRVIAYFTRWIERFPDISSLAAAKEDELLRMWQGLGYYGRARKLLRAARMLDADGGRLPEEYEKLLFLPGIGPYTAGAIMSIAFNRDYPVVDANVGRLFSRLFNINHPLSTPKVKELLWRQANSMLPSGQCRMFNQGLMELGALICLPQKPSCDRCPVQAFCLARELGVVEQRPVLRPKKATCFIEMATGILQRGDKMLIQKRRDDDVWANLWEFPGGQLKEGESAQAAVIREFAEETGIDVVKVRKIASVRHTYMHYRVTLHGFFCETRAGDSTQPALHAAQENRWVTFAELDSFAFPAGHRKLIDHLRSTSGPGGRMDVP